MLISLAVLVFLLWLLGFTVFHLGDVVHLLIVLAIAMVLWNFLFGSRNSQ